MHADRILFPTDGSASAKQAHRHAQQLADHFDAALHVIHVKAWDGDLDDGLEVKGAAVRVELHGTREGEGPLTVSRLRERSVVHPSAAGGILNYAVQYDVDLIVMGTHGRRGVRRLILGSVAEEVVRKVPCPVITVGRGASMPGEMDGGTMLVPVDFSEHRFPVMAHARKIAPVYDMDLTLLHIVEDRGIPDAYGAYSSPPDPGAHADRAEEALDAEADPLRASGIDVTIEVRGGIRWTGS